jgi:ABC-type enterochelin transport system substrate-binding protein
MKKSSNIFVLALLIIMVSCAVITVNIYFPEKDVKEAYKALEEELMTPNQEKDKKKPVHEPERSFRFEIASTAYAQEPGLSDKIASIVKNMPDVVQAYKEMGTRIVHTDRLRDSGMAGEANNGLLVLL